LSDNQVDPLDISYQGLCPSIHPCGLRSGFLIGVTSVHLFNDRIVLTRSLVWVPLPDNN